MASLLDNLNQIHNRVLDKSIQTLLLLPAVLLSCLVMMPKGSLLPYSCEIVFSNLIGFWNSIKCVLSSHLYICIIINLMVLLILASSSTFHQPEFENQQDQITTTNDSQNSESPPPPSVPESSSNIFTTASTFYQISNLDESSTHVRQNHTKQATQEDLDMRRTELYPPNDSTEERPVEEINFSEEDNTMEATWRSITEGGKQGTKKKELKKSETWNVQPNVQRFDSEELVTSTPKWKELRKSETFNDSVSITCRGGLRRDPSTSLEEFNKQVEDFIQKFNDSMKLQRQESDQRFLDMMKKGI
ncbi:hypothetical protein STAS_34436 [Striga asiatica]|uniref:DUF4408 domain-containing protein n=1 Tax=Striga asiatica TaxID=4170 RepID=A0A5A7RHP0_STRAF|nr:hypothetical protein STAS_34436 [Striga asiatica]